MNPAFNDVLSAPADTRSGLFTATAQRLGTTPQNVEKDFGYAGRLMPCSMGYPRDRVSSSRAVHRCPRASA